jgi:hypothetical protein
LKLQVDTPEKFKKNKKILQENFIKNKITWKNKNKKKERKGSKNKRKIKGG